MSEMFWIAVIQFATKFGVDAALAIVEGVKKAKTVDDAIAALELARTKTAAQYLEEARPKAIE